MRSPETILAEAGTTPDDPGNALPKTEPRKSN